MDAIAGGEALIGMPGLCDGRGSTLMEPRSFPMRLRWRFRPLRDRKTVIINLTDDWKPDQAQAPPSISLAAGGTYAIRMAHQERVGEAFFCLPPSCVTVTRRLRRKPPRPPS